MKSDKFDHGDIEKLANKIEAIKDKNQLKEIMDIIITHNADTIISNNNNGCSLIFSDLTNDTYIEIRNYIKKLKSKNASGSITNTDAIRSTENLKTEDNTAMEFTDNSRLKYSNREKTIIKRKIYETKIEEENTISLSNISDVPSEKKSVFIKKSKS